jgi:predicted transport protein
VLDELKRGPIDDVPQPPADREYWETKKGSKATVHLADELFGMVREIDPSLELQYNKHYIGIYKGGQPFNFTTFRPRKSSILIAIKLPRSDEVDNKIEQAGIEALTYAKYGAYRLSLQNEDIARNRELLKNLMDTAYKIAS